MATPFIFTESFDVYGPPGVAPVLTTQWSSLVGGSHTIVAGLSSPGNAMRMSGNGQAVSKTFTASYSRIAGSVRFQCILGATNVALTFYNGASTVFSLTVEQTGVITLRTGSNAGTIIGTGGAIISNSTHVLSWDCTIGAAAAFAVLLDGVPLFSGTGNTGNSFTSANSVQLAIIGNGPTIIWDDLIIADPTQPAYSSTLLTTNPVLETQFVSGDNQTQFANDGDLLIPAGVSSNGVARANVALVAPGANQLFLLRSVAAAARTINSVSVVPGVTNGTAKFRAVIYADSAGSPGALLSSGVEVVGSTINVALTSALTTPQALAAGTAYWIGFITDTSVNLEIYDLGLLGQRKAATYTSGAPANGSGMTAGQNNWLMWGNCTGATVNWPALSGNPPIGTAASQTHSSTVGQEDLFTFAPLVTNPSTIFGIAVKGLVSKSDAGARTASFNSKSVASDATGSAPGQALATTPAWQGSYFDVDPATGVAWTLSGANAAKAGVSVAS